MFQGEKYSIEETDCNLIGTAAESHENRQSLFLSISLVHRVSSHATGSLGLLSVDSTLGFSGARQNGVI